MIVEKVDVVRVTIRKSENDPPVPIDRYAPIPDEPAFERMEAPARKERHFGRRLGRIDRGKGVSDLEYESRRQARGIAGLKEPLGCPTVERLDQSIVMCQLTDCKRRPRPREPLLHGELYATGVAFSGRPTGETRTCKV